MKVLTKQIISTVRSGTYQYAVIEALSGKRATVRLGNNGRGARLTNLSIAGRASIGDLVIVDYSVNVPYVRSIQYIPEEEQRLNEATIRPEVT